MFIQHKIFILNKKMFNVKSCLFMQSKKWNSYQNHVKEPKNSKKSESERLPTFWYEI